MAGGTTDVEQAVADLARASVELYLAQEDPAYSRAFADDTGDHRRDAAVAAAMAREAQALKRWRAVVAAILADAGQPAKSARIDPRKPPDADNPTAMHGESP